MYLMGILKLKDEGHFSKPECSLEKLREMLKVCEQQEIGQMGLQARQCGQTIRDELAYREEDRRHQEVVAKHEHLCSVVDSLASAQSLMKRTVDRIHRIDVWILIAGAIAALSGVILIVVEIVKLVCGGK